MEDELEDNLGWKRPDEVMQLHRLKLKKRALQARMNRTAPENGAILTKWDADTEKSSKKTNGVGSTKRKNPFLTNAVEKKTRDELVTELETTSDSVLFELIGRKQCDKANGTLPVEVTKKEPLSFESVLTKLTSGSYRVESTVEEPETPTGEEYLPIDWTLKTKMRIMSPKPFAWNGKLKTSEEASGTTGFVRCLDIGEQGTTLDTSPNAR